MNFERMPELKWACGYDFGVGVPALNKFCQSLGGARVSARRSDAPLVRHNSKDVRIFQPASDRFRHFADEGGHSPPMAPRQAHQRSKGGDKGIAPVFQVEFDRPGRKYRCTSCRLTILSCKRHSRVLKQEDSSDLPIYVAGNPEAFLVAADEKCRDLVADDAGIERLKLRGDGWRVLDRQGSGAFGFPFDRNRRTCRRSPHRVWAR